MAINPADIQPGMEVFAIDGEQIGKVVSVQQAQAGGTGADLEALRGEAAGTAGGGALDDEAPLPRPGSIVVQDDGVLGVDARRLHLPFSAVLDVVSGRRITIDCTRDDAAMRYGHGPSLDIDENAKFTPF